MPTLGPSGVARQLLESLAQARPRLYLFNSACIAHSRQMHVKRHSTASTFVGVMFGSCCMQADYSKALSSAIPIIRDVILLCHKSRHVAAAVNAGGCLLCILCLQS